MNDKKQKKLENRGNIIILLCFMLIGAVSGFLIVQYTDDVFGDNLPMYKVLLNFAFALFLIYIVAFLQIIIHEAGIL